MAINVHWFCWILLGRVVLPAAFQGGPSVIPFGVGEGRLQSGVVQIPVRYTVGETVDFIRTVATVDRDYMRIDPAAACVVVGVRGEEGRSTTVEEDDGLCHRSHEG